MIILTLIKVIKNARTLGREKIFVPPDAYASAVHLSSNKLKSHGPHDHREDNYHNENYPDDSLRFFHKQVKIVLNLARDAWEVLRH
ncbi:MAG: hypothetical protein UT32_C0031G0002 [Parcubacteria group bacterium GW2011_GWC2_39_14]|nr:MAG: hypothetical protein UT32_C0031G0002 [Parcubacteria group bacterium GW2011_GWC2_39_14]KKR53357.1 MAG: hypothetical protein UT91_C0029G0003 [Parcubacteria group bacterium GW2011_GWA2_40_23]